MHAHTDSLLDASEHFNRAWADLSGDFILRARIRLPQGTPGARAGWLLRRREGGEPCVEACLQSDGQAQLLLHQEGKVALSLRLPVQGTGILQLERRGDSLLLSAAAPGEPFVHSAPLALGLPDLLQGGLFDCHQTPDTEAPASFSELRAIRPPRAGYVPYTDYIGSRLELLTVATGSLEIVHSSHEAFEAPNWRPDGRTLILNVSGPGPAKGLLRNFDVITRELTPLDTGFGTLNNNDHVLSFDGRQLAISHHTAEDEGRSVIYTLPSSGGTPRRVTPKSPSYLHGWSPDARWLVYTGGRRPSPGAPEKYDIYKIPAEGGEELRLTDSPGLSDGPEFSPDGRHIYYNSTRSGLMQLWRMRADGSEQEQLTDDAFNNWFPHLSPDGKWIAFLSYGQEVQPWEHPYYKHVYLRLMPATGGPARVLAYLYGGQGTMNVPCWSPDGTRIALVSNSG